MYSTVIKQQHIMIDRTEQERLLLSFITQKFYKTKGSIQSRTQNDALETKRTHNTQAVQPSEFA